MDNPKFQLVELYDTISQINKNKRNEDQNLFLDLIESKGLDLKEGGFDDKVSRIRLDLKDWKDIKTVALRLDDDWDENI